MNVVLRVIEVAVIILLWEYLGKDLITWGGFGTPFRRKNRKEQK
jgi:hypothetical protein